MRFNIKYIFFILFLTLPFHSFAIFHNSITSIEDSTCEDVEKLAKGETLTNLFGGKFKILIVKNSKEISRIESKLVCLGDVKLDNGSESKLRMEVYEEDDQIWYKFSQEIDSVFNNDSIEEDNFVVSKSTLKEKILNCKNISNNNDRLLCFDKMSKDIKTAEAVVIPSIEKLFAENSLQIGGADKPFYGCLLDIEFVEEQRDILTNEIIVPGSISSVSIGNLNNSLSAYVEDFANLSKGDERAPKIGDCFAFILDAPITDQPYWGWANGWAKIYRGNDFVVDDEVVVKPLKEKITVEEYFNDNVSYGPKKIELSGIVTNIESNASDSFSDGNIIFDLSSPSHENNSMLNNAFVVQATYSADKWQNSNSIIDRIKSIKIGDTLTVIGFFDKNLIFATHGFNVIEIANGKQDDQTKTTINSDKSDIKDNINKNTEKNILFDANLKSQTYLNGCGYPSAYYKFKKNLEFELIWTCPETLNSTTYKGNWKNLTSNQNIFIEGGPISTTYLIDGISYTDIVNFTESFAVINWNGGEPFFYDYE